MIIFSFWSHNLFELLEIFIKYSSTTFQEIEFPGISIFGQFFEEKEEFNILSHSTI